MANQPLDPKVEHRLAEVVAPGSLVPFTYGPASRTTLASTPAGAL